jgi:hypothetical protein
LPAVIIDRLPLGSTSVQPGLRPVSRRHTRLIRERMAAKLTGHVWSFQELFDTVLPAKVAA